MRVYLKTDVVEKILKEKNWTRADLAQNMEMSTATVSRVLNGDRGVGNEFIAQLIKALGNDIKDFHKFFIFSRSLPKGIESKQLTKVGG